MWTFIYGAGEINMVDYSMWDTKIIKNIPGSIDGILINLPVAIKINYNADINPDFSDIRFSLTDGTPLSYYITEMVEKDHVNVLVKIPSLPASPATMDINVYWNNPLALSESSPEDVYLVYDDFDGSVLDPKWIIDSGEVSLADSILTLTNDQMNFLGISTSPMVISPCVTMEIRAKQPNRMIDRFMIGLTGQKSMLLGDIVALFESVGGDFSIITCIEEACDISIALSDFDDFHTVKTNINQSAGTVEVF